MQRVVSAGLMINYFSLPSSLTFSCGRGSLREPTHNPIIEVRKTPFPPMRSMQTDLNIGQVGWNDGLGRPREDGFNSARESTSTPAGRSLCV